MDALTLFCGFFFQRRNIATVYQRFMDVNPLFHIWQAYTRLAFSRGLACGGGAAASTVWRGVWARVTIVRCRHLSLSTFKKHRASTNLFSIQVATSCSATATVTRIETAEVMAVVGYSDDEERQDWCFAIGSVVCRGMRAHISIGTRHSASGKR
jgi:hypothetical protein